MTFIFKEISVGRGSPGPILKENFMLFNLRWVLDPIFRVIGFLRGDNVKISIFFY